jgi:hypothetical protein
MGIKILQEWRVICSPRLTASVGELPACELHLEQENLLEGSSRKVSLNQYNLIISSLS